MNKPTITQELNYHLLTTNQRKEIKSKTLAVLQGRSHPIYCSDCKQYISSTENTYTTLTSYISWDVLRKNSKLKQRK